MELKTLSFTGIMADRGVDLETGCYWARVGERYWSGYSAQECDEWFEDAVEAANFTTPPQAVAIANKLRNAKGIPADEVARLIAGRKPNTKESK